MAAGGAEIAPGQEIGPGAFRDGRLRVSVPPGAHVLRVGLLETGFTHVKLGAPGADGPVVDHWNAAAVRRYLDHMSKGLAPALGGRLGEKLGGPLRASFVDSLELDHANWTDDLPAEFARRRGYELAPHLPFVLDVDDPADDSPHASTVRRARYDFHRTVVELFQERFLATYVGWAHENGLLARIQAYGRETHVLDGSLQVDLPEGESWLWSGHDRIVVSPTVANKYVSSAAHLAGRSPVSFEAMTNAVPVFREMPEDFKLGMDQSALAGVHHPVLHGFNYSPREAGFPGWVRFGSWFSEQNPWWPHVRRFTDYAARLTTVLSSSEFQASVALLGPRADEWARDGLLYQPFPEVSRPWYHYHLWQALQQAGYGTDFVSEGVLRGARLEGGRLRYGSRSYDTLAGDGRHLARAGDGRGGRALRRGGRPGRLRRALARSRTRAEGRGGGRPSREGGRGAAAPRASGTGRGRARADAGPPAARATPPAASSPTARAASSCGGCSPRCRGSASSPTWRSRRRTRTSGLVHHRAGEREIFFLANASRTDARDVEVASFRPATAARGAGTPRRGRASRSPSPADPTSSPCTSSRSSRCSSCSSRVIPGTPARRSRRRSPELRRPGGRAGPPFRRALEGSPESRPRVASRRRRRGTSSCARPAAPPSAARFPQLFDLSLAAGDPEVAGFGGIAVYRAEFDWTDETRTVLGLGTVARRLGGAAQREGPRHPLVGPPPLRHGAARSRRAATSSRSRSRRPSATACARSRTTRWRRAGPGGSRRFPLASSAPCSS